MNLDYNFCINFQDLIQSSCLAHDLGHPPFGHMGQRILNNLCRKDFGGEFDDNKQNIRLITGTHANSSIDISCALIDSLIKKKIKGKICYTTDLENIQNVFKETGLTDIRHPASYLMEISDDIAYLCGDLQDGLKQKILSHDSYFDFIKDHNIKLLDSNFKEITKENINKKYNDSNKISKLTNPLLRYFISHAITGIKKSLNGIKNLNDLPEKMHDFITKNNSAEGTNFLYWNDQENSGNKIAHVKETLLIKKITRSKTIMHKEHLAKKIITQLWEELIPLTNLSIDVKEIHIFHLLPKETQKKIIQVREKEKDNAMNLNIYQGQYLCDFISGMTDRYAIDFWHQITNPISLKQAG